MTTKAQRLNALELPADEDRWLSITEAARMLGMSRRTIYRRINDGLLRAVKPAGMADWRVPLVALREYQAQARPVGAVTLSRVQ